MPTLLRSHTQPSLPCLTHGLRLFVNRTASELSVEAKEEGERQAAATWPNEGVLLCIAIAFVIVMSILSSTFNTPELLVFSDKSGGGATLLVPVVYSSFFSEGRLENTDDVSSQMAVYA